MIVRDYMQEYIDRGVVPICTNCTHRTSEKYYEETDYGMRPREKNVRCGIGGFEVSNTGTCRLFNQKALT